MDEEPVVLDYENTDQLTIRYKGELPGINANDALSGSQTTVFVQHKESFQIEPDECGESFTLISATVTFRNAKRLKFVYYVAGQPKVPIVIPVSIKIKLNCLTNGTLTQSCRLR